MYRFESSRNPSELKKEYLKNYNVNLLQWKLDELLRDYPDIKEILPEDISAKKLLVGSFKYLAKVYCAYTRYLNEKTHEDAAAIRSAFVRGGFKYDSHKIDIARFMMEEGNGFEIHNCVYCDLEDVTFFIKADGAKVRRFETEHVLDKGECPLVALSLYNFVPSCNTCNRADIKGTKTIGDTETEIVRLSPSAEGYDFSTQVRFEVKLINPDANDLNALDHPDDYEIQFNVGNSFYQKSIDLFQLKPRYNQAVPKLDLLKWRELRRKNPNNIVQQFANIKGVPFDDMFEEMFELELRRKAYFPKEKARRDVMLMY